MLHDIIDSPISGNFCAGYSLDVLEHIHPIKEHTFMQNICESLDKDGVLIIGTPNKSASSYASEYSTATHINLKTKELDNIDP